MAIVFHERLFDPDLVRAETGQRFPVKGSPEFANTDLGNALTGVHQTNVTRTRAYRKIVMSVALVTAEESAYFQNFWLGGFGSGIGFRCRYVPDYTATQEVFATSDGIKTEFPLLKTFNRPGITTHSSIWRITKPVVTPAQEKNGLQLVAADGVTARTPAVPFQLFLNGSPVTGWTVDATTGIVYRTPALSAGTLSWSGEHDIPVAFVGNSYEHGFDLPSQLDGITLREIPPYELGILV